MLTNESSEEIEERIKSKYSHICEQLDIDETIKNSTWETYRSIRNDHTLEVSWLQSIYLTLFNDNCSCI